MKSLKGKKPPGANETVEVSPSDIIFVPDGRFLSLRIISKPAVFYRINPEVVTAILDFFRLPDELNNRMSNETRASLLNDLLETETKKLNIISEKGNIISFSG